MNDDTRMLLKECDAGCKMAARTMDQAIFFAEDSGIIQKINEYKDKHAEIGNECHSMLNEAGYSELDPSKHAKKMAWLVSEIKYVIDNSVQSISEMMIDGCNMGIKSISKYLNEFKNASEQSKDLAKRLIVVQQEFMNEMLCYI